MLCRFAHVQSVTFFAHAVVCTVILRRGRGSATFGSDRPRRTPRHRCGGCRRAKAHSRVSEGGGRAWPGFEIDYSEPKARVWRSRGRAAALRHQDRFTRSRRHREPERRAGGPDGTRNTSDAATTSVSEGGGRAWPLTIHPRHQCGGCRRAKVHSRVPEDGGRAWPGFEIDHSEPQARVWRSRGRARRHPEHQRRSHCRLGRQVTTSDAATTSVSEGGGRAWPGFEIDYSEPKARVWRSRGRAAALRHQDRFTRSRRHREPVW